MRLSAIGTAVLVAREGRRLSAYRDSVGIWTIGVGHTSAAGPPAVGPGLTLTAAECDAILDRDAAAFARAVTAAAPEGLPDHAFDALVSLCFNIGTAAFARSTVARRLRQGDRAGAADAILMWNRPAALIPRRQAERDQFLTPYAAALPRARRGDKAPARAPAPSPNPSPSAPKPGFLSRPSPASPAACAAPDPVPPAHPVKDTAMIRPIPTARLAALLALCLPCAACAAEPAAAVTLPWGDALAALAQGAAGVVLPVAATAAVAAFGRIAGPLRLLVTSALVERLVRNVGDYALNAVAGAARGRVLTIPVGSAVIAAATQRALDQAPAWLMAAAGGPAGLAEKVFRSLRLEPAADAGNTLAPALPARRGAPA